MLPVKSNFRIGQYLASMNKTSVSFLTRGALAPLSIFARAGASDLRGYLVTLSLQFAFHRGSFASNLEQVSC